MKKRQKFLVYCVLLWLLLLVGYSVAQAHPADMFSHVQRVGLSPRGIEVTWELSVGPILAPGVWSMADTDGDEFVSEPEARAYVAQQLPYFTVSYKGNPLDWQIKEVTWPRSLFSWQLGEQQIEVRMVRSRSLLERMSHFERIEKLAPLVSAFVVLTSGAWR